MVIPNLSYCVTAAFFALVIAPTAHSESSDTIEEIRAGLLYHDIKTNLDQRYEKGANVNAELLFTIPDDSILDYIWSPRPHLGVSINTQGGTSQFYGGLTWHFAIYSPIFLELSLGGELHNGRTAEKSSKRQALGSQGLFRESVSLGVEFCQNHTLSVMLDHASNASLTSNNPGLTSLGLRYGYKFS
ncbi:MAG: acyloxyacyl hydrolase [Pseudomonadota bacterium]